MAKRPGARRSPVTWILIIVLLAVIAYCACKIVPYYWQLFHSKITYKNLANQYTEISTEDATESDDTWWWKDVDIDLAALKDINPDICGWIRFDHTQDIAIDYPVLTCMDNNQYLHTDLYGRPSYPGCIFLDKSNDGSFTQYGQLLYGHNMRNGTMFGTLKHYQEDGLYEKNPYFTVYTADMAYRYHVFSFFTTTTGSPVYVTGFQPDKEYQTYLEYLSGHSEKDTGVAITDAPYTLVLSTCRASGTDSRFVVCAVCEQQHAWTSKEE